LKLEASGDRVVFGYLTSYDLTDVYPNLVWEDSQLGSFIADSIDGIGLSQHASHWARVLAKRTDLGGQTEGATGSIFITADAPTAAALDGASAFGVYRWMSNGTLLSEAAAPVIFQDQAAVGWNAGILDPPPSLRAQAGAVTTAFAVANLSPDAQAVLIR